MNIAQSQNAKIQKNFVGRKKELKEFEKFVCSEGEKAYRVLFVHGPGGIGKTWLLRKMMEMSQEFGIPNLLVGEGLIDMFSTNNRSIEGVQNHIVDLLEKQIGNLPEHYPYRYRVFS